MRDGLGLGLRGWGGLAQRTTRATARRLAVARGKASRRPRPVRTFWWDNQSNFGDQLNIDVLHSAGVAPVWSPAPSADLIPIGSLLEHLPPDFDGAIWGSGMIFDQKRHLPHAEFLAVRGHLTWRNLGCPSNPVFGDPGLLARRCYGPVVRREEGPVALVPHLTHRRLPEILVLKERLGPDLTLVDVTASPAQVVASIASASAVVSTSLHGLIVADSYGVPASWWHPDPPLTGGRFKFRDYESALGDMPSREGEVSPTMSVQDLRNLGVPTDVARVETIVQELSSALERFTSRIPASTPVKAAIRP